MVLTLKIHYVSLVKIYSRINHKEREEHIMGKIVTTGDLRWGFPFTKPNSNQPSPYLYQVILDHEIPPGMLFHDCLVSIAESHKQHPRGNTYACYGTWIGKGIVWLIYPMESADDELLDDEASLCHSLGDEPGKKRYQEYRDTLISEETQVLHYMPELSHPSSKEEQTPLEYIYYRIITCNNNVDSHQFTSLVQKIISAHKAHPNGINWVTYKEPQSNNLHLFAPMRHFGAMDNWPNLKDVLKVLFGHEEAHQIRQSYYANILDSKTQIMTFVPSCDNSGCQFVE